MLVIPYNPDKHQALLQEVLDIRHIKEDVVKDLPEFGLVALNHDEFVAAGFIRKIEGYYAMLDSYISNPSVSPLTRDQALDIITAKLVSISKEHGVEKLLAFSADTNTIERSIRHGFIQLPNVFTVRSF